jgi:hypothetical protein
VKSRQTVPRCSIIMQQVKAVVTKVLSRANNQMPHKSCYEYPTMPVNYWQHFR